jgi:tripartite-type tricarboxylate transporter receptor subunit TctC
MTSVLRFVTGVLAAALLAIGGPAQAQDYPAKPVRLIVPYPAGTANEVFARIVAQKLGELWKSPVVVEAIAGAGGVVGTQALQKAAPDGYTLGWVSSPHAINPAIYANLPYDPVKDFRPIANLASTPLVFVAKPSFPGNTIADLLAAARKQPGGLNYASNGNGSASHLATALLENASGARFTHVPYKNTGQMTTDLVSGRVDFAALGVVTSLQFVQSGKLKALAVTSAARAPLLPDVAAVAETVPGYETKAWMGVIAPKGTPDAVIAKVQADLATVLHEPAVLEAMKAQALVPEFMDAGRFGARIEADIRQWKRIVAEAGIHAE